MTPTCPQRVANLVINGQENMLPQKFFMFVKYLKLKYIYISILIY